MTSNWWLGLVGALALSARAATAAPAAVYENRATVENPVVDATTFLNRGIFNVFATDQPYDTQNTRNFTNFAGASITGSGGVRFEYVSTNGVREAASNFVNFGLVSLSDPGFSDLFGGGFTIAGSGFGASTLLSEASWIMVNATNVLNRGGLAVGSGGLIKVQGSSVNLSRSGLRAGRDPFAAINPGTVRGLTYNNETGITDLYWGVGQNNTLDPGAAGPYDLGPLLARTPRSGPHETLDRTGFTNIVNLPQIGTITNVFAVTNALSPTNWVIQAVFVNTNVFLTSTNSPDPNFKVDVKFGAPRIGNIPGAKMPIVRFAFEDVDTITTEPYTNFVYVLDSHGALTNSVLMTNRATRLDQRPSNFVLTRVTPVEWGAATPTNAIYKSDLLYNSTYGSQQVTNWYSAYSARIGQAVSGTTGATPGGFFTGIQEINHPTNQPGRIEVSADRLDLALSRFRSEGLLSIKAKELTAGVPYKLDAANVSMDVGNPKGTLTITNLVQPYVRRFNGTISLWSGIWTNTTTTTADDPANPGTLITNTVEIRCHALIVQHRFVPENSVTTYRFAAKAPKVVLNDSLNIREAIALDTPEFESTANIDLGTNALLNSSFTGLKTLRNRGVITTADQIALGSASAPIATVENSGRLTGSLIDLKLGTFENSGSISSTLGDFRLSVKDAKLDGGTLSSVVNLWIAGDDIKAQKSRIQAGYQARNALTGLTNYFLGALHLDVSGRLADGGVTASNVWTTYDGVQLHRKPASGDLLGTKIIAKAGRFAEVVNAWAGEDRGAVPAGYVDNAALGELVLDGLNFSVFTFRSATGQPAALYVDYLRVTNATSQIEFGINIEPGFKVYFADSNLPVDRLNGLFEGRLVHVPGYTGALSSEAVLLSSGQTIRANRGLLRSSAVDSDRDGIPNSEDESPFEPSALRIAVEVVGEDAPQAEISWAGWPGGRYRIEVSDRLSGSEWRTLGTVDAATDAPAIMSYRDSVAAEGQPRFYRVVSEVR